MFLWGPTSAQIRHYPYRFGLRVLRILPQLQEYCYIDTDFGDIPTNFDPLHMFKSMSFNDLWEDAGAPEILEYIRGNKHLHIPSEWKAHVMP